MILTETDDIKLADFGLAQEYIALKQIGVQRDDGVQYYNNTLAGPQWMTAYAQYYMNTLAGTPYWMAPEVFLAIIQRKPTFFPLVLLFFFFFFFAIFPRDCIMMNGKILYGVFKDVIRSAKLALVMQTPPLHSQTHHKAGAS